MTEQEFLKDIGITQEPNKGKDGSYILDIIDSDAYGRIYSILDKAIDKNKLNMLDDNQVITEQGSSLMYEAIDEPYLLNLLADFDGNVYELIITKID